MNALAGQDFAIVPATTRGRPPVTRARVLRYWEHNGPCPVRQVCRDLGVDRTDVKRILRRFADLTPVLRTQMR